MRRAIEQLLAELTTLAAAARRTLERGELPDLAPLARGIEGLGRLTAAAAANELTGLQLRFAALTDELAQLAQAAAASLARTSAAIAATRAHHQAIVAYSHAERHSRSSRGRTLAPARVDEDDSAGRVDGAEAARSGDRTPTDGDAEQE